ncbi:uncharacterized protein p-cup [Drosophila pseudoobscura]|uniref:Uncharacterized protein p-cup n=1 Tax=Drosophila pseudoobscura pseudoobscura TaxID=46245 RepID=A0A6I8UFF7_DROPS|nr:uncharacterized protein LOC4815368 [Drosophila pseudoobscura]
MAVSGETVGLAGGGGAGGAGGAAGGAAGGVGKLAPEAFAWQHIDWPPCVQAPLFMDWGKYYSRRLLNSKAIECYGRALAVCKEEPQKQKRSCKYPSPEMPASIRNCTIEQGVCRNDYTALFHRSLCQRSIAQSEGAFEDATRAKDMMWLAQKQVDNNVVGSADVLMAECDALFDCNEFEETLRTLHTEARFYNPASQMQRRFDVRKKKITGVFEDTVGATLGPFLQQNSAAIDEVLRRRQELAAFVPRPLWKKLKEQQQCDVQSVLERKTETLTSLERARRRASKSFYNHQYLGRSAVDVALLQQLRSNQIFLNPLMHGTTPYLRQLSGEQYGIVRKFMKMMHARNPLYNSKTAKCQSTSERCERSRERYLFHVEYQTRRDCLRMLRDVRRLRAAGNVEGLTNYIEHIMSKIIDLKTHRTLPWKWEFVNDVYNTLALAHVDQCALPANVDFLNPKNRLLLYLLQPERAKDMTVSFGGPNLYMEIKKEEARQNRSNQKMDQLEERLRNSRYPIERAYLRFELARGHFKEFRFDKSLVLARSAFNEARSCNSLIWRYNSIFLVCQVHAVLSRFERLKESLAKASQLAKELKSTKLMAYLAICNTINENDLNLRKLRHSEQSLRSKPRKRTISAVSSLHSLNNSNAYS